MKSMIHVENLVKTFKGNVQAVRGVSFSVEEGEFFAFLGPNGAGKSTTIQMITTLLKPTSGRAEIAGFDVMNEPEQIRRVIGVALQETGIDPQLTGRELLEIQGKLFGFQSSVARKRADELLELVGLTEDAHRKCGKYSGGMRRRLDLALTLVQRPKVLFLDEPTTGLDPYNRKLIWEEIRSLNKEQGTTIFLTTQYLEEADELADRISIINEGKIVASGTQENLKASIGADVIDLVFSTEEEARRASALLARFEGEVKQSGSELRLFVEKGPAKLPEIIRQLDQEFITPITLNVSPPSLDDVFLNLTGHTIQAEKLKREESHV
ncbi:ATP-binding cassette domain-containing protein [Neobacillus niacini]|uniref:ATP-binding cassette domain-containing protein n=1 Tax=Neobacillus niacini TaxID=86668 RepID=UPI0021CB67B6|nr:ATP-binding cassette domain-containing protein [Neobacillus niacini]MCM3763764.1 ATP-binding cassette domain-containing protein [Neobacillus niacini]